MMHLSVVIICVLFLNYSTVIATAPVRNSLASLHYCPPKTRQQVRLNSGGSPNPLLVKEQLSLLSGGAMLQQPTTLNNAVKNNNARRKIILASSRTAVTALVASIAYYRFKDDNISLMQKQTFKEKLLELLQSVDSRGLPGMVLYTMLLMLWEGASLPTTPVETTAGMAFGIRKAMVANFIGKNSGAFLTFLFGRIFFYEKIHSKLGKVEIFTLAEESSKQHPLTVALMIRFAPLPEIVKLFILSLLNGISLWVALIAILIHGLPFTVLWTLVGNEATLLMTNPDHISSKILRGCTVATVLFGIFVSPTLFGLWVHSLRNQQKTRLSLPKTD